MFMSRLTYEEILNSCIKGIKKSHKEYEEWNGWQWLWEAPEYLLTVNIAKEIAKVKKTKYITLEDNIKETLKNANAKIKGALKKNIRANGRSDIVLWWGKETPRGIIEVKNGVDNIRDIKKDVDRIIGILEKESDIQLGVVTFYMFGYYKSKNPFEALNEKLEDIVNELSKISKDNNLNFKEKFEIISQDEETIEVAVACMFYR